MRPKEANERQSDGGPRFVRSLFDGIAFRYDLVNSLITFGQIGRWRRRLARDLRPRDPKLVLDLGTGTADLALAVLGECPGARVAGVDLSREMLRRALVKAGRRGRGRQVAFLIADATSLPFKDGAFDSLVNAFFLRHLPELPAAFVEFRRVLRPGGSFFFLELTQPRLKLLRRPYRLWFERAVPLIGWLLTGQWGAYRYLPRSLDPFPDGERLASLLRDAGFERVSWRFVGLKVVALHAGQAPAS